MFDFEKYSKDNLSFKEELELFRIFNGNCRKNGMEHVNYVSISDPTDTFGFRKNRIAIIEKSKQYLASEREE